MGAIDKKYIIFLLHIYVTRYYLHISSEKDVPLEMNFCIFLKL